MTGEELPNTLYLVLLLVLVGSALAARQLPLRQAARMALAWVAIFGAVLMLVAFKDEWKDLGARMTAAISGAPPAASVGAGGEIRIPMRDDGHFWIEAEVNGVKSGFLVDSGASYTTIGADLAAQAGVEPGIRVAQVETANGTVVMRRAEVSTLSVGPIVRDDFPVLVAPQNGLNVVGMNFLSSLRSWRAEGRTLVLQP